MFRKNWDDKLINAAKSGNLSKLQEALENGADINAEDEFGNTTLIWASSEGHADCVEQLIVAGANIDTKASHNDTALIMAAHYGNRACIEILIKAGADINAKNIHGDTALKTAASKTYLNSMKKLIKAGADINDLSKEEQKRYAYIIKPIKEQKQKPQTYALVNNHIVVKHEGKIPGVGALRKIFDFHSKTVTEVINETPGPAKEFATFHQNKQEILKAHSWLKKQGHKPPHPLERRIHRINK